MMLGPLLSEATAVSKLCPNEPEQQDFEIEPGPPLLNASLPERALPSPFTLKPPRALPSAMLLKTLPVPPLIALACSNPSLRC
jgi:hypothetical protein